MCQKKKRIGIGELYEKVLSVILLCIAQYALAAY